MQNSSTSATLIGRAAGQFKCVNVVHFFFPGSTDNAEQISPPQDCQDHNLQTTKSSFLCKLKPGIPPICSLTKEFAYWALDVYLIYTSAFKAAG